MYRHPVPFAEHLISHNLFGIPVGLICIRSEEKKSVNTSSGDAEIGTAGPTGEVKGLIVTGCKVEDHEVGWEVQSRPILLLGLTEGFAAIVGGMVELAAVVLLVGRVWVQTLEWSGKPSSSSSLSTDDRSLNSSSLPSIMGLTGHPLSAHRPISHLSWPRLCHHHWHPSLPGLPLLSLCSVS